MDVVPLFKGFAMNERGHGQRRSGTRRPDRLDIF
jgi:hypothetical protein